MVPKWQMSGAGMGNLTTFFCLVLWSAGLCSGTTTAPSDSDRTECMVISSIPYQCSPAFLAPGTGFKEDNFSKDGGWGGWFRDDSSALHLLSTLFLFFFFFYFIFKLYIIVLVLPNIKMNPPQHFISKPMPLLIWLEISVYGQKLGTPEYFNFLPRTQKHKSFRYKSGCC